MGFLAPFSEAGHPHRPLIWGTWWGGAGPVQSDLSFAWKGGLEFKLISGSSCSTVRGRISRSPCLGRGSWEAFLSSSSRVPCPGAELAQATTSLGTGPLLFMWLPWRGFPTLFMRSLNPAVFPEPFTLALGTTNISGPCGWRDLRQWCGCHVGLPPAAVCLLSCRPVPGAPWEVAPVSWLKDAVAGWGRRGEKSLERHVWCFVWF